MNITISITLNIIITAVLYVIVIIGWLKRQLEVQLNGLSGHLQLFWADIENSSWIGGNADTDLHERNPYWMNGVLPLAYQLKNQSLIDLLKYRMEYIMDNQKPDGWLGPDDANDSNIYWSRFMQLLVMVQYYEATEDHRVIESMFKFLKKAHRRMFTVSFGNDGSWYEINFKPMTCDNNYMYQMMS